MNKIDFYFNKKKKEWKYKYKFTGVIMQNFLLNIKLGY